MSSFIFSYKSLTFHFFQRPIDSRLFLSQMPEKVSKLFDISQDFEQNPFTMFKKWMIQAKNTPEIADPTTMHLATSSTKGRPSVRVVLLKNFNEYGFTFFTNGNSYKGQNLQENPQAEINFYWAPLGKQIRIFGTVSEISTAESDEYFASRHITSQMGACVSKQSSELQSYDHLKQEFEEFRNKTPHPQRPQHWKGYRITPQEFEFWLDGAHRLHLRHKYFLYDGNQVDNQYTNQNPTWKHKLLYP